MKQRKLNKSLVGRQAKKYIEANPRLKGIMGLYRDVFAAQRKLSQQVPDQLPHIQGAQISYRIEEGRTLIEPDELEVDVSVLKEMMKELGGILREKSELPVENMDEFIAEELEDEGRLQALAEAFLKREEGELSRLMEDYSLHPTLLYMLLHISMAPFFWKKAGSLARKADLGQVSKGSCPVCGDLPVMGFLRSEDGLRVLECSLCGSRWGAPRVMCPFCSSMDQKKMKYIFADDDDSRRVYLCDNCGKYIKISAAPDEKAEEFIVPLEDLATAHLDLAAEERDYRRGCRTVFS